MIPLSLMVNVQHDAFLTSFRFTGKMFGFIKLKMLGDTSCVAYEPTE